MRKKRIMELSVLLVRCESLPCQQKWKTISRRRKTSKVFLDHTSHITRKCVFGDFRQAFILTAVRDGYTFSVQLEKLSTLYLPYDYSPTPEYELLEDAAEQLAYDVQRKIVYSVGNNNIHVIDLSDVTNMTLLHHTSIDGVDVTDVEYCGGYVFISMDNKADKENGMVKVYRGYNESTHQMELIHTITVGAVPDMLYPTHDCMKVLVAVEAEPYVQSGTPRDPEGGVAIIKFQNTPAGNFDMKILNFTSFNDQIDSLERDGVRFVYRGNNNTFANDVEPEYIAYNTDETKAYIGLQENNAIAVVDLETGEITSVHGLGFKDWSQSEIDTSDEDGENGGPMINQRPWPVYGMYQPDTIKFLTIGGVDYLLTANEGDSKDYNFFSEEERGHDITLSSVFEPNATKRAELQDDKNLGRLKVTTENGRNATTGEYDVLYSFGGRSFSIWRADDMSLVFDSGKTVAYQTFVLNPNLFNSNVGSKDGLVASMLDSRSDDKGPETESLEIAEFGDYILVIVGNERPGTLSLFSIDKTSTAIEPKFEGMFHDIPRTDDTWNNLYNNREISMLDPEDMRFIAAEDSPNNKPLLVVSGSVSGTITVLQINVADVTAQGTTPVSSTVQLRTSFVSLTLTILVKILVSSI